MADSVQGQSVYLLPGLSVKIKIPVIAKNSNGWRPARTVAQSILDTMSKPSGVIRGFVLEDTDIGDIVATSDNELAVTYTHRKAKENAIWFFTHNEKRCLINIVSVPIHDHSSIVQGGPAFGTYFSDDTNI